MFTPIFNCKTCNNKKACILVSYYKDVRMQQKYVDISDKKYIIKL